MKNSKPNFNYRDRLYENYGKVFQGAPDVFDEESSRKWGAARIWHLRGWLPKCKSSTLVDLACGGGKLLHFFRDHGYCNISGVDISADQVALARQVVSNVTQGDVIDYLEANHGRFDLIIGFDMIEHLNKEEVLRFLDAAFEKLHSGGRLIIQTPNAEGPWGAQYRYGDFTHEIGFTPSSLTHLMQLTGFSSIECRECDPVPFGYSILSTIRAFLWQIIRLGLITYNLIETGNTGYGVYTRVFLASGIRK